MPRVTITDEDEGKDVVDAEGEQIGIVTGVRSGTAYVNPDPSIGDRLLANLGWDTAHEDDYPLDASQIDAITDDQIRLTRDL